jgi:hypothetical protein
MAKLYLKTLQSAPTLDLALDEDPLVNEKNLKDSRLFVSKKFQLSPTLSFLGESTPSLEKVFSWLGVKDINHTIPKATHTLVIDTLEDILSKMCMAIKSLH